ncbi:MAG TPA: hypothetical protein VNZ85_09375 [Caulobacter sp.]|nr:hypothetical protein [Caulobacter sp.]
MTRPRRDPIEREDIDWYARVYEYAFAIGVLHRSRTSLLVPGSGAGQRLRQAIICELCTGPSKSRLDWKTFVLTFDGPIEDHLRDEVAHPHFERELARLYDAGILEWHAASQTLRLNPPPLEVLRAHIAKCREHDAEYWRAAA